MSNRDRDKADAGHEECLNVEADVPKVVEIVIGDHAVISGVLNTGSVLSIRATGGGKAAPIHLKTDHLNRTAAS